MNPRVLLLLALFCIALPALGWKREGHRIVADLAQRKLSAQAQAEVARLLANEPEPSLAGVADWADEVRKADPTDRRASWHFVNFRDGTCDYVPARDCPDGNCVVAAINRQFLILSDRSRPDAERRDALKYLVHLVADVHQPLHATPRRDKGGGDYQVELDGRGTNLHAVWDRDIILASGLSPADYAARLAAQAPLSPDPTGRSDRPAVDWALESCRIVRDGNLYPPGHHVGPDYLRGQRATVEGRLRLAGDRLAGMINYALAPPRPRSHE
jgi:nuclease S1